MGFPGKKLEWVVISFSRGSSQPRDQTQVSCISYIGRWVLYHCTTWETHKTARKVYIRENVEKAVWTFCNPVCRSDGFSHATGVGAPSTWQSVPPWGYNKSPRVKRVFHLWFQRDMCTDMSKCKTINLGQSSVWHKSGSLGKRHDLCSQGAYYHLYTWRVIQEYCFRREASYFGHPERKIKYIF